MATPCTEKLSKTILSEASGYLDTGFTHSLNPYSGCAFACQYCYVREMPIQRFKDIPWGEWVESKTNAAELYLREIARLRRKDKPVRIFMSSATDPYQPVEREAKLSRSLLQAMVEAPPDLLQLQTRSPLVTRDLDLLEALDERSRLIVSMTVETDREDMKRLFAPYAPGISQRLRALRTLHDAGIVTQAAISPVLPFTPAFPQQLEGIVERIWIDTLTIGDGAMGRRSGRLGMPDLFRRNGLADWYAADIHTRVYKYFLRFFPPDRVHLSKEEAFPN
ncbi:radical SAM protein [Paenibacillus sp. 1P07SE]|uniref:SPL family radical SAM protein n=1 Tax=Paenibacillus sp. 1P07SE TaxID=3132209 RepID=UPI0039A491CF